MTNDQSRPAPTQEQSEELDDGTIVEPSNSTVDDWRGQKIERDTERAEQAVEEAGGDMDEAQECYEQVAEGPRPEDLPTEERRT